MENKNPIYTMTASNDNQYTVCMGYVHELDEAIKAVTNNYCDMYEANNTYMVIEKVYPGIQTMPHEEWWFMFNRELEKYEPCEKPAMYKQICGFSM